MYKNFLIIINERILLKNFIPLQKIKNVNEAMILVKKKIVYLLIIIYIGVSLMFSCKVQRVETVKQAEKKQAKIEWAKAKEDHKARRKAYKRHLSVQDKATRKRMKSNIKKQKKQNKIKRKDRVKGTCPNRQVGEVIFMLDNQ